jgi:hypothetical protein
MVLIKALTKRRADIRTSTSLYRPRYYLTVVELKAGLTKANGHSGNTSNVCSTIEKGSINCGKGKASEAFNFAKSPRAAILLLSASGAGHSLQKLILHHER